MICTWITRPSARPRTWRRAWNSSRHQAAHALELSRTHQERGNEAWVLRLLGEIAAHGDPPEVMQAEAYY